MEAGVSAAQSVMVLKQTQDTCSHAGSALMSPWQVRIPSSWIFHFPACPTPSDKSQDFPRLSQTDPAERRRMAWGGADCFCFDSSSSSSSSCEIVNWVERTIISSASRCGRSVIRRFRPPFITGRKISGLNKVDACN